MADYTANIVAQRLGVRVDAPPVTVPASPRLEEWGPLHNQIAVGKSERDLEEAGYARSLRFINVLSDRLGPGALTAANGALARGQLRATARTYLDVLEDSTGQTLAPLFSEWALTDADIALLPARAETRRAAAALRQRSAQAGLSAPADLEAALREWSFPEAGNLLAIAGAALEAYDETLHQAQAAGLETGPGVREAFARSAADGAAAVQAQAAAVAALSAAVARAREPRSPLARVGLAGANVGGREQAARAALAAGDAGTAEADAAMMTAALNHARRDGFTRLGAAVSAGLLLAGGLLWRRRSSGCRPARRVGADRLSVQLDGVQRPPSPRSTPEA
jgi:hypothetical protein